VKVRCVQCITHMTLEGVVKDLERLKACDVLAILLKMHQRHAYVRNRVFKIPAILIRN
jgi:hypothetical protein